MVSKNQCIKSELCTCSVNPFKDRTGSQNFKIGYLKLTMSCQGCLSPSTCHSQPVFINMEESSFIRSKGGKDDPNLKSISGGGVTRGHLQWHRLIQHMTANTPSSVTTSQSCIVSEISQVTGRNSSFWHLPGLDLLASASRVWPWHWSFGLLNISGK